MKLIRKMIKSEEINGLQYVGGVISSDTKTYYAIIQCCGEEGPFQVSIKVCFSVRDGEEYILEAWDDLMKQEA